MDQYRLKITPFVFFVLQVPKTMGLPKVMQSQGQCFAAPTRMRVAEQRASLTSLATKCKSAGEPLRLNWEIRSL